MSILKFLISTLLLSATVSADLRFNTGSIAGDACSTCAAQLCNIVPTESPLPVNGQLGSSCPSSLGGISLSVNTTISAQSPSSLQLAQGAPIPTVICTPEPNSTIPLGESGSQIGCAIVEIWSADCPAIQKQQLYVYQCASIARCTGKTDVTNACAMVGAPRRAVQALVETTKFDFVN